MTHVALITGAGRGIGAAIAQYLAEREVACVLAARTVKSCAEVAARIEARGGRAWAVELDVTDPDLVRSAVQEARELCAEVGPLDWLVNNAGMAISAPILAGERSDELYERHLEVNFHGPRHMIEACVPDMIERGYGRVVNVASSAALMGYAYVSAYVSSKHAILGYTRSAAVELERTGVTFHTVCPHYVDSPMTEETVRNIVGKTGRDEAQVRTWLASQNPGGRLVRPDEVAAACLTALEGDENGTLIELDGSDS